MTTINATSLLALRSQILQQNAVLQRAAGTGPTLAATAAMQAATPISTTTVAPATTVPAPAAGATPTSDFSAALKGALEQVNGLQANAETASNAYEKGESTDIASVMLAREKASIGFQATLQVRNKLLSAYKDIMSMSV